MDTQRIVEILAELGFSHYEGRAYVGLVGQEPLTGYALSNLTEIPQPKVYETLRRLERKRAVIRTGSDPARFVAVPPEQLVAGLDSEYRHRLDEVRTGLSQLTTAHAGGDLRVLEAPRSWSGIRAHALRLLQGAERHVYVSGHVDQLTELTDVLANADARGVRCDVLSFGHISLDLAHGRVLGHSSTQGVVYRHHQARHLAVVVDSVHALWALAPDGGEWGAMAGEDRLLAALVKGYVRHDVYVQQIFADFPKELVATYGPSLERLVLPTDGADADRLHTSDGADVPPVVTGKNGRKSRRSA